MTATLNPPPAAQAGNTRKPWHLPAERVVFAIRDRAESRRVPVYQLVPPRLIRRYERAAAAAWITVDTAELLAVEVLGVEPDRLYGPAEVARAREAMAARRRPNRARQHWMARMALADYQRAWDAMATQAVGGVWRGTLPAFVEALDLPATYGAVLEVLRKRGWARVVRRGMGGPYPRPTVVELLARPAAERWPCANPLCRRTISSVTADGHLTVAKQVYCSTSCENAVHAVALGRKLDLLRREAGLELTGKGRLNAREVDAVLRAIGQLRRVG